MILGVKLSGIRSLYGTECNSNRHYQRRGVCVRVTCFGSKTHSNENEDEKETCKRAHAIKSSFNWIECVIIMRHPHCSAATPFYYQSGENVEIELIVPYGTTERQPIRGSLLPYCDYIDGVRNSF